MQLHPIPGVETCISPNLTMIPAGEQVNSAIERHAKRPVVNPILPGFYPDPSICRAGEDYYLVTSSFAYFPGVPIFHSRDLVHWRQIGHVLNRPSQLNLTDQSVSAGIFAPTIRYHQGLFYMITTFAGGCGNFYVTAVDPAGPWSDPIVLGEVDGIDPSFFFDDDGEAYVVNNGPPPGEQSLYDGHRAIWLQKIDLARRAMVGQRQVIVNGGTDLAKKPIWIEAPHLFRRNGWFYLICAEGGTAEQHSEVVFRSRSVWGPYEPFAGNPILTQRDLSASRPNPVTCAGHADFVQTLAGDWIAVFLACQPYDGDRYYNTGRETFLLPVDWSGEWPQILPKGQVVPVVTQSPLSVCGGVRTFAEESADWSDDFEGPVLKPEWAFIRTPVEKWFDLAGGSLVMQARPIAIGERANPSFIGRRAQHAHCQFRASLNLAQGEDIEAGIVAFQNEKHHYALLIIQRGGAARLSVGGAWGEICSTPIRPGVRVDLQMQMRGSSLQCAFAVDESGWTNIGSSLDARELSTAVAGGFVGMSFGLYAFGESPAKAVFHRVRYRALPDNARSSITVETKVTGERSGSRQTTMRIGS